MGNEDNIAGKREIFEKIANIFSIESIDDLIYKMPFMITHDIQRYGFEGRENVSQYKNISPDETYLRVYENSKILEGQNNGYFNKISPYSFESIELLKFKSTLQDKYSPLILTCLHQPKFAADFINNYLAKKEKNYGIKMQMDSKEDFCGIEKIAKKHCKTIMSKNSGIVHVDVYLNGKIMYGHFVVSYNGKIYEASNNDGLLESNITWDKDSFDLKKVKEKKGWNCHILSADYPVQEDWLRWGNNVPNEKRNDARKKLWKWEQKNEKK